MRSVRSASLALALAQALSGAAACPAGMVPIPPKNPSYCIDKYEASLVEVTAGGDKPWSPFVNPAGHVVRAVSVWHKIPQGYIGGDQAQAACEQAGKRLCTETEWVTACKGPGGTDFPYGRTQQPWVCNDSRPAHPVQKLFGTNTGVWDPAHMNDPRINQQAETIAPSGVFAGCTNSYGVFDMVGNLHEWIADPNGTFRGGYYMDVLKNGTGCNYKTTKHDFSYHDYSTGFRCCKDGP